MNSRREQHSMRTRQALVAAGRKIFGRVGFAEASLATIGKAARVTTGAIYHHFGSKEALFQEVAESVERDILTAVLSAAGNISDPRQGMRAGIDAMLGLAADPVVRRIVFLDAPNVLGAAVWREIETRYAFGVMKDALAAMAAAGMLKPISTDFAAAMLLGALIEAAHAVANADGSDVAKEEARKVVSAILSGLLA